MLKIKIPPRIHITLISMHEGGYRQNGGIGFAIDAPSLVIAIQPSSEVHIEDKRENGFNQDEQGRIDAILHDTIRTYSLQHGIEATITGDIPTHMGFGSSTAVRLALIEGLFLVNKKSYDKQEIIRISGRGGVSGIGVESYFEGGFVFDLGRKEKHRFAPSSAMETQERPLPLLCKRVDMPQWQIGLCVPDIKPKSEEEEKHFFSRTCPIPQNESHNTLYHATYGVLASVIEDDIDTFAESIKNIQKTYWKNAEGSLYDDELISIEQILYESGAMAVGMSSLGPSLYFVADNIEDVILRAQKRLKSCRLLLAHMNNAGRSIGYD